MYNPYSFTPGSSKLPWIQYQANNPYDFTVTERTSDHYKNFIKRIEANYALPNNKLSACLLCWGLISPLQKRKHTEHEPFIVTASLFKNEESFLQLCQQHGKCSGNRQRVILFKEQCQFFGTPGYNPEGGTQSFSGGSNPLSALKDIQKKGFEFEFTLKRMNIVVQSVKEDFTTTMEKKLEKLETQFKILE